MGGVTSSRQVTGRGVAVMAASIITLSSGSTVVKWASAPGPVVAAWRLLGATVAWWIVLLVRRRYRGVPLPSRRTWRAVAPAGVFFGLDLVVFFAAVNATSVAHAEFITALTPLLLVPIGVVAFHERPVARALPFGLVSLAGLAVVMFGGSSGGTATARGDLLIVAAMGCWISYLVFGRRARATVGVVDFMATVMPIGLLVAAPAAAIDAGGELWPLEARAWAAVAILSVTTGMVGHALIAVAQRLLAVGTISVMQVAQPAIAVCWAYLLLGETIEPVQVPGMALVVAGLVAFTVMQQRRVAAPPPLELTPTDGELTGTLG